MTRINVNVENVYAGVRQTRMALSAGRKLQKLRERAELSGDAFAKKMGYSRASSIQRYEAEDMEALPIKFAARAAKALVGKGTPPITLDEVLSLAPSDVEEVKKYIGLDQEATAESNGSLRQSGVDPEKGENAVQQRIDRMLESMGALRHRVEVLEREVAALKAAQSLSPTKARKTL